MARRPKARSAAPEQTPYQRRIARARAQGKSLQEARGHKPREHIERKEREIKKFGFTTRQRDAINAFADEQTRRRDGKNADPSAVREKFQQQVRLKGYDAFVRFRNSIHRMHRQKRVRPNRNRAGRKPRASSAGGGSGGGGGGFGGVIDFDRAMAERDANLDDMYDLAEEFFDDPDDFDLAYYH